MNGSQSGTIVFDPVFPAGALAALAFGLLLIVVVSARGAAPIVGPGKAAALGTLRGLGIGLLALLLLRPSVKTEEPPPVLPRELIVAVDSSLSMAQAEGTPTRYQQALETIRNAGLEAAESDQVQVRFFHFDKEAVAAPFAELPAAPAGETTQFDRSIQGVLDSLAPGQGAHGVVLLTDGHDFELINPAKTGLDARMRQAPIYPIPFGDEGRPRDVSVRIASYQPYSYVNQKSVVSVAIRLLGVEYEELFVTLIREGKTVETKRIRTDESPMLTVDFSVLETEPTQVEYEVRVRPVEGEQQTANNAAITFLNVIDKRIRLLLIEAMPSWDTTFFQRALLRNDKMQLDSIIQYAPGKVRRLRQTEGDHKLELPGAAADLEFYDGVILGRDIGKFLGKDRLPLFQQYVDNGGTLIFLHGPAWGEDGDDGGLQPVRWLAPENQPFRINAQGEGRALAPFRTVADDAAQRGDPPEILSARPGEDRKPLAAVLAAAEDSRGQRTPAFVHRRVGQGQVLSLGVGGMWRWAFNEKIDLQNPLFTRFWDQMILWLMAGRLSMPTEGYSLRASTANVTRGDSIHFRLIARDETAGDETYPVTITRDGQDVARLQLARGPNDKDPAVSFTPSENGRFQATVFLPGGQTETARFMVSEENLETTEVTTDHAFLEKLASASGGQILQPAELQRFVAEIQAEADAIEPVVTFEEIWSQPWIFYLTGCLLAAEWWLRRRWGLA